MKDIDSEVKKLGQTCIDSRKSISDLTKQMGDVKKKLEAVRDKAAAVNPSGKLTTVFDAEIIILENQLSRLSVDFIDANDDLKAAEARLDEIQREQNEVDVKQFNVEIHKLIDEYNSAAEPLAAVCRRINEVQYRVRSLHGSLNLYGTADLQCIPRYFHETPRGLYPNEKSDKSCHFFPKC
jgi:chromosome segregation ATPase